MDADGVDLRPALAGQHLPQRLLYAESFAPLLDFGWSSLRTIREGRWKAIAAPRRELYDVEADPGELRDVQAQRQNAQLPDLTALWRRIDSISGPETPIGKAGETPAPPRAGETPAPPGGDAAARLGSLGYVQGGRSTAAGARPDPKDRRELAARISAIASGELQGGAAQSVFNLRLSKVFALPRNMKFEAIGEIFNLFNAINPSFGTGAGTVGRIYTTGTTKNASFMKPSGYAGDSGNTEQRIGQIGFRFTF